MKFNFGLIAHSAIKVILIALILGLGVNYGFFIPKGRYSLDYTGILGDSASIFLTITLVLHLGYRIILNMVKWVRVEKIALASNGKARFQLGRVILLEMLLLFLVVSPVVLGIYWSQTSFAITDLLFHASRFYSSVCIIGACGIIYSEKITL